MNKTIREALGWGWKWAVAGALLGFISAFYQQPQYLYAAAGILGAVLGGAVPFFVLGAILAIVTIPYRRWKQNRL